LTSNGPAAGTSEDRQYALLWTRAFGPPDARMKLDCEESRQSTAISLSEAPPLAMLVLRAIQAPSADVGHHFDQPCSWLAVSAILRPW
jgi:hypothetical protein